MAEQKTPSGRVIGVMAFAPWILYGFASGFNHWRVATGGAGAVVVVSLVVFELVVSVCASPTATLPNSTATPKAKAAVFDECFIVDLRISPDDWFDSA